MMTIGEALAALGASASVLSQPELESLDRNGFTLLRGVLSSDELSVIRRRLAELQQEEGDRAGLEVHQEAGTERLSDLINKDPVFHVVLTKPRVLAAIAHVLDRDMKLSSLNSRAALPGQGQQGLHADWGRLGDGEPFQVCNSIWMIDDFTPANGATRVVPGSHRSGKAPSDVMADPSAPHPDEVMILGTAGDVGVFNAHTWHGGTLNRTASPRRAMHGYFCRRHHSPQLDQQRYLRPETWNSLTEEARVVLGVDRPPDDAQRGEKQ